MLWDVDRRQPIGNPVIVNGNSVGRVVFSPDGSSLATASGGIILWDMDPETWAKSNCQRAGRNLTRTEWAKYFLGKDYPSEPKKATCPQWPLDTETNPTPTS